MGHTENDYQTGRGAWLLTFVLGGLIGAAVALLVAPKSGRQTRERLRDMAHDAQKKAEDYYDQAKSRVSDAMHKSADVLSQQCKPGEDADSEQKDIRHCSLSNILT